MTAKEAFDKTEKLLEAYASGDLLGGNPMQHIESYGSQEADRAVEKEREAILKQLKEYLIKANSDITTKTYMEVGIEFAINLIKTRMK